MDPLVDDSVAMAKKLKGLGISVGLDVLAGLPHGFLNMILVKFHNQYHLTIDCSFLHFKNNFNFFAFDFIEFP